jgi:hypothetical protein
MTMRWSLQDLNCLELTLAPSDRDGLRWFFLLGWIDDSPAVAEWSGARLRVSSNLLEAASVAVQVDRAFADSATSQPNHYASLAGPPGRVLVTLADCCDGLYALETIDDKGRRSW